MITKEEIYEIVKQKIESDEKLGEQSGGSGHLGYTSYTLNDVKTTQAEDGKIEVRYSYTLFVETEFTYYPDNPPKEYPRTKVIVIEPPRETLKP